VAVVDILAKLCWLACKNLIYELASKSSGFLACRKGVHDEGDIVERRGTHGSPWDGVWTLLMSSGAFRQGPFHVAFKSGWVSSKGCSGCSYEIPKGHTMKASRTTRACSRRAGGAGSKGLFGSE
jgi:hypothetical protein